MSDAPAPPSPAASEPDDSGTAALDRLAELREVTVRAGGRDLWITLDSGYTPHSTEPPLDPGAIAALLPRLRALVADFETVRARATGYLWEWGATGDEPPEEKAAFLRDMVPTTLAVTSAAELELHYEDMGAMGDTGDSYMMEGYWPVVRHDGELNPVAVTVES
ncbi:hypothetical protein [Streptomyces sp. NPDC058953]|uniref:hypothetical protein n=1 Tax=unclassified Streptomyces TaxID=2593676 RepID=UPI00367483AE